MQEVSLQTVETLGKLGKLLCNFLLLGERNDDRFESGVCYGVTNQRHQHNCKQSTYSCVRSNYGKDMQPSPQPLQAVLTELGIKMK